MELFIYYIGPIGFKDPLTTSESYASVNVKIINECGVDRIE